MSSKADKAHDQISQVYRKISERAAAYSRAHWAGNNALCSEIKAATMGDLLDMFKNIEIVVDDTKATYSPGGA